MVCVIRDITTLHHLEIHRHAVIIKFEVQHGTGHFAIVHVISISVQGVLLGNCHGATVVTVVLVPAAIYHDFEFAT